MSSVPIVAAIDAPSADAAFDLVRWALGQPRDAGQLALVSGPSPRPLAAPWVLDVNPACADPAATNLFRVARPSADGPAIVTAEFDLLGWIGRQLALEDESDLPHDRLARPQHSTESLRRHARPVIDDVLADLRSQITSFAHDARYPFWAIALWPGGAPLGLV